MNEELNQPVEQQAAQEQEAKSERDYNFKMMRDRAEAAEQRAAEIEALYKRAPALPTTHEDDSDLVEKRYVRRLERELEEARQQREDDKAKLSERLLRQSYSDFDDVVTTENIQKLARRKPAIYRSIQSNTDMFDKGETAYDAIKAFVKEEKRAEVNTRLEANEAKPKSASSMAPQPPPTGLANIHNYQVDADGRRRLSPERVKELQKQLSSGRPSY